MSAAELRQAAERLRMRADAAILASGDDLWDFTGVGWNEQVGTTYTVKAGQVHVAEANTEEQAVWVSTMHPGTGLALAAWLSDEAGAVEQYHRNKANPFALDLARLINGGAS